MVHLSGCRKLMLNHAVIAELLIQSGRPYSGIELKEVGHVVCR